MDAALILYAVIAAGLVIWLRSILGTRHGDERERPNPFTAPPPEKNPAANRAVKPNEEVTTLALTDTIAPALPRGVSISNEAVSREIFEVARSMPDFDLARFAQGAQDAFAIIVEAFAVGDRDTLKNLLEPQVYTAFDGALKQREAAGETMTSEIHAVRKMDILEARKDSKSVYIKMRIIADETCVIKNKDGAVISGDPDRITEMNDIWTFSKPLKSRDPMWYLHETRDGDVTEDHKTPVPDAG